MLVGIEMALREIVNKLVCHWNLAENSGLSKHFVNLYKCI